MLESSVSFRVLSTALTSESWSGKMLPERLRRVYRQTTNVCLLLFNGHPHQREFAWGSVREEILPRPPSKNTGLPQRWPTRWAHLRYRLSPCRRPKDTSQIRRPPYRPEKCLMAGSPGRSGRLCIACCGSQATVKSGDKKLCEGDMATVWRYGRGVTSELIVNSVRRNVD